jgi:hypothetical protein
LIHTTAAANWSLGGSILTFAFPMVLFIVAATVLYLLFSRPHRIPGHSALVPTQAAPPDTGTAHTMASAAGLSTAPGAGADPLAHEPAGGREAAQAAAEDRPPTLHQPGTTGPAGQPGTTGPAGQPGTTGQAGQPGTTGAADPPQPPGPSAPHPNGGGPAQPGSDAASPEAGE